MSQRDGITISRSQLEAWARRPLSDDDLYLIGEYIPHSSIPDAIEVIANEVIPTRPALKEEL